MRSTLDASSVLEYPTSRGFAYPILLEKDVVGTSFGTEEMVSQVMNIAVDAGGICLMHAE
jgi:hypothetical protein